MDLKNNHIIGVLKAMLKLKPPKIDKIISTGGYVSFPVLLYGILHHIHSWVNLIDTQLWTLTLCLLFVMDVLA